MPAVSFPQTASKAKSQPTAKTIIGTYENGRETITFLPDKKARWKGHERGVRGGEANLWMFCGDMILEFKVAADGALAGPTGSSFSPPLRKKR
jgi:hypothetical protein